MENIEQYVNSKQDYRFLQRVLRSIRAVYHVHYGVRVNLGIPAADDGPEIDQFVRRLSCLDNKEQENKGGDRSSRSRPPIQTHQ